MLAKLSPGASSPASWATQAFADGASHGRMIGRDERSRRFARLQALGGSAGVRIRPCRCKNPELTDEPCAIAGPGTCADREHAKQDEFGFLYPNAPAQASTSTSAARQDRLP
jgi:hypothetical protein